jgi:hypothetical protein
MNFDLVAVIWGHDYSIRDEANEEDPQHHCWIGLFGDSQDLAAGGHCKEAWVIRGHRNDRDQLSKRAKWTRMGWMGVLGV